MARILVGTQDGLHEFDVDAGRAAIQGATIAHPGRVVTAVAPEGSELWAILDGSDIWHTAGVDGWFHFGTLDGLGGNCLADTRAGVIIGTSEAHLFRVAGEGLEEVVGRGAVGGQRE